MAKKKKYKISAPRFIAIVAGLIALIAIIIIISVKKAGKADNGALVLPSEAVGEVTPAPSQSASPTPVITATPLPTASATPVMPTLPPATPTPAPTLPPVPTLTPTPGLQKDPKALTKPTKAMKKGAAPGIVTGNNVNLRQGPSTNTPFIAQGLKKNDAVTIYTISGNFYFVKVDRLNKYGYIAKNYVKKMPTVTATPKATPSGTAPAGTTEAVVSVSKVALRASASTDSKCIGEYAKGTKVYIISKEKDFYYVHIGGKTGYVYAKYIKVQTKN